MQPVNFCAYKRIILVGSSGSGKSWLSRRIAAHTGHPVIHLDNEFWQPGWVKTPREQWVAKQKLMVAADRWIIDGNYDSTLEVRFTAADLVVFLDINRAICLWSALRRRGQKRSDLPDYLEERPALSRDFLEFCGWIWRFPKVGRQKILDLHARYPEKVFLQIRSRKELKALLRAGR